jgi:hypothetical protein
MVTTDTVNAAAKAVAATAQAAAPASTSAAAAVVDDAAAVAAPVVAQAARTGGMTGTGWLGLGAGAAGIAITLLDAWKQSVGSQKGLTAGAVVNPATIAIGGGATLLTVGEKLAAGNPLLRNGMRAAGIALVLGGLAGAISGALNTFGNPLKQDADAFTTNQSQAPTRFGTTLPPAPANLVGVEVATADVIGTGRKLERVPVYVDPTTAKALPGGTDLGTAIGNARAAAQGDPEFRSHAVVQTQDGAYWVVRLSGKLDQVDGPKYADGTSYDDRYEPQLSRRQQAVQAIAGIEGHYAFPEGMEATAPVQYPEEIPWVTPELPGAKPQAATPSSVPAAPTTTTTTPVSPATAGS